MAKPPTLKKASPKIASLLGRVRSRIRSLVFGESIAASIAALIAAFWVAFVLDYLPVRFGYAESPTWVRIGLLVATGIVVSWVFYRLFLRRFFVRMRDSSMAMLVENKYQKFNDSLLASVSDIANARASKDRIGGGTRRLVNSSDDRSHAGRRPNRTLAKWKLTKSLAARAFEKPLGWPVDWFAPGWCFSLPSQTLQRSPSNGSTF